MTSLEENYFTTDEVQERIHQFAPMLASEFGERTFANMEVALQRACSRLSPEFDDHESRKLIAQKIIDCARKGETSLSHLTAAGVNALHRLDAAADT